MFCFVPNVVLPFMKKKKTHSTSSKVPIESLPHASNLKRVRDGAMQPVTESQKKLSASSSTSNFSSFPPKAHMPCIASYPPATFMEFSPPHPLLAGTSRWSSFHMPCPFSGPMPFYMFAMIQNKGAPPWMNATHQRISRR